MATVLSALSVVTNLQFETDVTRILPTQSVERQEFEDFQRGFPSLSSETTVAITATDIATIMDDLELGIIALLFADGVEEVISIFALPGPQSGDPLMQSPDVMGLEASEKLDLVWQEAQLGRMFISQDRTITVIAIRWLPDISEDDKRVVIASFERDLGTRARVTELGGRAIEEQIIDALKTDQTRLILFCTLICIGIVYLLLGSLKAVIVVAVPPLMGVVWSLGAIGLLGIPLDPLLMVIPTLLLVLGIADAMHFGSAISNKVATFTLTSAISTGVRETAPAAAITSLTTIFALVAMLLAAGEPLRNLAIFGTIGLLLQLVSVSFGVGILFQLMKPTFSSRRFGFLIKAVRFVPDRLSRVTISLSVVVFALAALAPYPETSHSPAEQLPMRSPLAQTIVAADQGLGGAQRLFVVFDAADTRAGLQAVDVDRLETVIALARPDRKETDLSSLGQSDRTALLESRDGTRLALPIPVRYTQSSTQLLAEVDLLLAAVSQAGIKDFSLVGESLAASREIPDLLSDINKSLYITIFVIGILALFILGSIKNACLFMLPNALTLMSVAIGFGVLGSDLTMTGALALTIAFGISVDDTVHFWNRYRINQGLSDCDPVVGTIIDTTPPIFYTTVIVACGFATLCLSDIPALVQTGLVLSLAACVAMVCDLFVLPSFLKRTATA